MCDGRGVFRGALVAFGFAVAFGVGDGDGDAPGAGAGWSDVTMRRLPVTQAIEGGAVPVFHRRLRDGGWEVAAQSPYSHSIVAGGLPEMS